MAKKRVELEFKTRGARKAAQQTKKVDKSLVSLGRAAVGVASAFFAARGLIRGYKAAIELAKIQEQAERKLATALGYTSQKLLNHARALQKVSTFGDENIIAVQASIAAFVDSEEAIKRATEATLDISVAMGMDLKAAGDLVAKTLGSSTNAMSRYGIEVEGAVGSTERLESLVGNASEKFGGMALAISETTTGQLDQIKGEWSDAMERIGTGMLDAFEPKIRAINDAMQTLGDIGWEHVAKAMMENWRDILQGMVTISVQMGQIIGNELRIQLDRALTEAYPRMSKIAGLLGDTNEEFAARLQKNNEESAKQIQETMNTVFTNLKNRAEGLKIVAFTTREGQEAVVKGEEKVADAVKKTKVATDDLKDAEEELFATSIAGLMATIKGYLVQASAKAIAAEMGKGLPGLITGTAAAIGITALWDQFITPNLAGFTGQTPTVNNHFHIAGVDDSYVRNQLLPAMRRVQSYG